MNHKRNMLGAALVFAVLGGTISIGAAAFIGETNMAGISKSLDKYSTEMVSSGAAITTTTQAAIEEKQEAEATKAPKAKKTEDDVEKEDTSGFKLNLVYDRLGVVKVKSYLNVRKNSSTSSKIVGKMTNHDGCHIYKVKNGWAKIVSGKVTGWVKSKYLVKDEAAEKLARKVATLRVNVTTETLNVRYLPSKDARVYDQISIEEEYDIERRNITEEWLDLYMDHHIKKSEQKSLDLDEIKDNLDDWMCISIDNEKAFVNKKYVEVTYNLDRAVSIKETKKGGKGGKSSSGSGSTLSSLVNYAMQFLGNRYVYGGTSLTGGTDCSGFTMRIYEHFGYSIPRTSSSQAAALRSVSSSQVRPGDLFFYGSGSVSHVAMYIGNGQVIHASNARDGIKISYAYYRTPLKIGRVIG